MNLNPFRRKSAEPTRNQGGQIAVAERATQALGPWSDTFAGWIPRATSPALLEALREAVPVLDGGINRLVTLDGILEVQGGNDRLVAEIEEWSRNTPVNDVEGGLQAMYAGVGGEFYEQGIGIAEYVYEPKGRDVVGMRVADSKGIKFARDGNRMRIFYRPPAHRADRRPDGLGTVESLLRGGVTADIGTSMLQHGYVELDPTTLVINVHQPEADNPYGTSIMRSVPFVAQILLKMQNATGRSWERFGDPPFHVHYGTKNRKVDGAEALRRARSIVKDLALALSGKARGNSVDLATGAGADDEIKLAVIGAAGEALTIEAPARHMLEQVVAAFGLPPWMLGITWSQAAGIGEQQSVIVLQEAQTRFSLRSPALHRPIESMLRARGRTWKAGDWQLVQRLPNLMDEAKRAQAAFLRAQTALMLGNAGQPEPVDLGTGIDNNLRASSGPRRGKALARKNANEDEAEGEPWAEPDEELPRIERRTIVAMLAAWWLLHDDIRTLLGLDDPSDDSFTFDPDFTADMLGRGDRASTTLAAELLTGQMGAWERGVANAGLEVSASFDDPDTAVAIERLRVAIRAHFQQEGLSLVRAGAGRRFREAVVAQFAAGTYDGMNPLVVARQLRQRFGAGEYNWERLARSEIAWAQSEGKLDLLRQQGVTRYDYVTAGDDRVSDICLALEAASPYDIDDPASPLPMRDSHPNCRCTIRSRA